MLGHPDLALDFLHDGLFLTSVHVLHGSLDDFLGDMSVEVIGLIFNELSFPKL